MMAYFLREGNEGDVICQVLGGSAESQTCFCEHLHIIIIIKDKILAASQKQQKKCQTMEQVACRKHDFLLLFLSVPPNTHI